MSRSRLGARMAGCDAASLPGTPIPEGMDPETLSTFHNKNRVLSLLRKRAQAQMSKFNSMKLNYTDWYKRQSASFIDSLKTIQALVPGLVPSEIHTITHYKRTMHMAQELIHNNRRVSNYEKLEQFVTFWHDYCDRKRELDEIVREVHEFLLTVAQLRNPELRSEMMRTYNALTEGFGEDYLFGECHNEKDNLFTYGQTVQDQRFLGLVGYIPFLLALSAKTCYSMSKLYIEKP